MQFSYIALNQKRRKLTGILSAEDESEAKEKLHEMGLSIISLEKAPDDAKETVKMQDEEEQFSTFVFHVADSHGNETRGTIDAKDRKTAYYRLVSEYNFQVFSLCDISVPEDLQEEEGKKGLEELKQEIELEFGISAQFTKEDEEEKEESITQTEEFLEMKKDLVEQVEEVVEQAKMVLEKFKDTLSGEEIRAIQTKIDHLMRLRLSNNLKYIQDLADELLGEIDDTLKKHTQGEEVEILPHEEEDILSEAYVPQRDEDSTLAHIQQISRRMQRLLGGYKKEQRRIQLKKKKRKHFPRLKLFFRSVHKILWSIKRMLTAKNRAVRMRYMQQLRGYVRSATKIFTLPKKSLATIEQEIEAREKEDALLEAEWDKIEEFQKTFFLRLFEESRLFFGWLLGFYIAYFYISLFLLTKFPTDSKFHHFLYQSITSQFPFLALGIFFLIFLGLTLIIRFARNNMWYSPLFLLFTAFTIILFLANF